MKARKPPSEPLETFVADCLRIIKARRLERVAAMKEAALKRVMAGLREV